MSDPHSDDPSAARWGHVDVATARREDDETLGLPVYRLQGDALEMGPSFGNGKCWVTTRGNGDVESVFSIDVGREVFGALALRYAGTAHQPAGTGLRPSLLDLVGSRKVRAAAQAHTPLLPEDPGDVELHVAYQRRRFELPGRVEIEETVFVPRVAGPERSTIYDGAVVYQIVELRNRAAVPCALRVYGYSQPRGQTPADVQVRYDDTVRQGALVMHNASQPDWVRIYGVAGDWLAPLRYASTFDTSQVYALAAVHPLENDTTADGDVVGALQVNVELAPGARRRIAFVAVFSAEGESEARRLYAHAWDFEGALRDTVAYYARTIAVSQVLTPDTTINEGVTWAKANMVRVMADYPQGRAFTNDPGHSSNVVGRDAAWFVSGCDYLLPQFSRALLDAFAQRQLPAGKIVEYYDAITGETEDYGLNINDNTPLFIVAVDHHYRATGDAAYLRQIYPAVERAANYLISQIDTNLADDVAPTKRGLVYCSARGEGTYGIAGWRNIIGGYAINGAVTEINAECVGALRAASRLAHDAGCPPAESARLRQAADDLAAAINQHLLNPENGLYYLNIDVEDNCHTNVTADELFPVMFGVAPDEVAYRIVSRLHSPDFWTPGGIRNVSRQSLDYSPYRDFGLMGGVWPGVTWWLAIAAGHYYPQFMVWALRASFEHYAREPRLHNTVPGQFSEWFDGESLVNRGMRLSPWEPPRFVWAAIEGVCGVAPLPERVRVRPLLPADWKWVALRRLPYRGQELTFFAARQGGSLRFYSTMALETEVSDEVLVLEEDVTERVRTLHQGAHHVALRGEGVVAICVGSARSGTIVVPIQLRGLLDEAFEYSVALYNSERDAWEFSDAQPAEALDELSVVIEAGGFRVLALHAQQ